MEQSRLETLAQRDVYANDGTRWRVREARAHDVPGAQASSCLIFDGGSVCRRLWKFPERWKEFSDDTLLDIMEQRR